VKKGLTNHRSTIFAIATSTGDQYDHGYWLRERIFVSWTSVCRKNSVTSCAAPISPAIIDGFVKLIDQLDPGALK